MQLTEQQQQLQELHNAVISKCWEDELFKKEFMANPVLAIKDLTGNTLQIPEGKKLVVVDQTDETNVYFNIPAMPDLDSLDLTDEELERIAGGITPGLVIFAYFAGGVAVGMGGAKIYQDW